MNAGGWELCMEFVTTVALSPMQVNWVLWFSSPSTQYGFNFWRPCNFSHLRGTNYWMSAEAGRFYLEKELHLGACLGSCPWPFFGWWSKINRIISTDEKNAPWWWISYVTLLRATSAFSRWGSQQFSSGEIAIVFFSTNKKDVLFLLCTIKTWGNDSSLEEWSGCKYLCSEQRLWNPTREFLEVLKIMF